MFCKPEPIFLSFYVLPLDFHSLSLLLGVISVILHKMLRCGLHILGLQVMTPCGLIGWYQCRREVHTVSTYKFSSYLQDYTL
jgi:hypothetical protein